MMKSTTIRTKNALLASWCWVLLLGFASAQSNCKDNLTEVALSETFVADRSIPRTYNLCPDRLYATGVLDPADGELRDGFFPIAFYGNCTVQCGENGLRSNNCEIGIGDLAILMTPFDEADPNPIDFGDSYIRGISIVDIFRVPVFTGGTFGNLNFVDCAFLNSIAQPNIQLSSVAALRRRRRDVEWMEEYVPQKGGLVVPNFKKVPDAKKWTDRKEADDRYLQTTDQTLHVTFTDCLFEGNEGPSNFQTDGGLTLIFMPDDDVDITLRRAMFRDNFFPQYPLPNPQADSKNLLSVFSENNKITIQDSCFLNNEAHGFALVQSVATDITISNVFVDPVDTSLQCPFVTRLEIGLMNDITSIGCVDFDASECTLFAPTAAPSASPTRAPTGGGFSICFSGRNQVEVEGKGKIDMKDLQKGDSVLTGNGKFEPVYGFGHTDDFAETDYLQIYTDSSRRPLEISSDHMVFTEGYRSIPAANVQVGDKLILGSDSLALAKVLAIKNAVRKGSYAPFTESGTIVVNGILASSFVAFQEKEHLHIGEVATPLPYQWLAHTFEAPHRMMCAIGFCKETYTTEGVSRWVDGPLKVSQWMLRQHPVVHFLVFVPALTFFSLMALFEATVFSYPIASLSLLLAATVAYVLSSSVRVVKKKSL
eukprot:CAMPEP_0116835804 /NCGR_PEP_ID=MMETSP0418-20121206/7744_1 /TAXON_ID=1158023 /ORGANISM="Astrosyne radiata, Strain 13vi08-1A" /LENGTH=651 /DNA_ID=CAMNT_0004465503 /DNA_START=1 /DNA_END=1956 /DNA_ORIENTATION=-